MKEKKNYVKCKHTQYLWYLNKNTKANAHFCFSSRERERFEGLEVGAGTELGTGVGVWGL